MTIPASFVFSDFFMNLVDRDLTEYQITQTLTIVMTARTSEADKGNQTVLITFWSKQEILRSILRSMQCISDLCESVE